MALKYEKTAKYDVIDDYTIHNKLLNFWHLPTFPDSIICIFNP